MSMYLFDYSETKTCSIDASNFTQWTFYLNWCKLHTVFKSCGWIWTRQESYKFWFWMQRKNYWNLKAGGGKTCIHVLLHTPEQRLLQNAKIFLTLSTVTMLSASVTWHCMHSWHVSSQCVWTTYKQASSFWGTLRWIIFLLLV